jgi:hypothetical protein
MEEHKLTKSVIVFIQGYHIKKDRSRSFFASLSCCRRIREELVRGHINIISGGDIGLF